MRKEAAASPTTASPTMSDGKVSVYDRVTAAAALASVVLSAVAVAVSLRIAYFQQKASDRQNQYAHALGYTDIYFSDAVISARDTIDGVYLSAYPAISASDNPNAAVAQLLATPQQQLSFDRLISLYDQIATCVNTNICDEKVAAQLYGRDILELYQNWYGYILARRNQLSAADYGCPVASFLAQAADLLAQGLQVPATGCPHEQAVTAKSRER